MAEWFGRNLPDALTVPNAVLSELYARQYCARWNYGDVPRHEHRKWIIQKLWPSYSWHAWMDRRLESICNHDFVTWMGPGGSGKSTDAAILALEWWMEAPHESAVLVCSTTKGMLKKRIWKEIAHYHSLIPRDGLYDPINAQLLDAECMIRWKPGDMTNGIFGVAVMDGPVDEAINNLIGIHTRRVFWILDEMQGVREAIMGALPNMTKNPEPKFLGMGNPDDLLSMLCRYSEPLGGWSSIPRFSPTWEINPGPYKGTGRALFFDGRKSPAVLDPEWSKKNPWMINQEQIEAHLRSVNGNENDPGFMTQSIGWPPSKGLESTILDASILTAFKVTERAVFTGDVTKCASLDPAFNGGDRAVLQFGRRGVTQDEEGGVRRWQIAFDDSVDVPIDSASELPIHYQIVYFCRDECLKRGIPSHEFACAAAGEGGGLVSIFETEWGPIVPIEEGGSPSDRIVNERGKTAKETYDTRASELCFGLRDFALGNGIRGLPVKAAEQACARKTFYQKQKWCAESKVGGKGRKDVNGKDVKGFKQRMGYSPDDFDSCIILIEHCRMQGAEPQIAMNAHSSKSTSKWNANVRASDNEYSSDNYTLEQVYG